MIHLNIIVSLLFSSQSETSEQIFKKIEDSIEKAKSISIRVRYQRGGSLSGDQEKEKVKVGCTILVKDGNEVSISTEPSWIFTEPIDLVVISNGSRMRTTNALGITKEGKCPATLTAGMKTILSRTGYFGMRRYVMRGPTRATEAEPDLKGFLERDVKKVFQMTDLRSGGEGDEKWIKYALKVEYWEDPTEVTLWYNPKNYQPTKRRIFMLVTGLGPKITVTDTETYEEFTFNREIPDEKFRIPEK